MSKHRDGLVGALVLYELIEQRLNAWKVGAVFAVLEELLFPLDEAVGDRQSVRRRRECVVSVGTRLRKVAVKARVDGM